MMCPGQNGVESAQFLRLFWCFLQSARSYHSVPECCKIIVSTSAEGSLRDETKIRRDVTRIRCWLNAARIVLSFALASVTSHANRKPACAISKANVLTLD